MSYVNYHYTDDTNKLWRKPLAARYIAQNAHLTDLLFWAAKSVLCPGSAQTRWGAYSAGHTGIQGNERVDEAAKAALGSTVSTMKCPASDFIPELAMHYREVWQAEWDGCSANKLPSVKPHLGYCSVTHLSRRDAVILRRLRIAHTRVTHKYLLSGDSQPLCDKCKCSLTVKHILLDCCSLMRVRENYFTCSSLKELFENVDATTIMDFIKEVSFYHLV